MKWNAVRSAITSFWSARAANIRSKSENGVGCVPHAEAVQKESMVVRLAVQVEPAVMVIRAHGARMLRELVRATNSSNKA